MKKWMSLLLVALLCSVLSMGVAAEGTLPRVVDNGGLLSGTEETNLEESLESLRQAYQMDIVIVTEESIGDATPREYADDYFDFEGYGCGVGRDGALLLISMEERDWYISTSGYGIQVFTDAGIEYIGEQITPELADEDYYGAFSEFSVLCEKFIVQAKTGEPYDIQSLPKADFAVGKTLLIALTVGFVIALIVTLIWKGQLKSVRKQTGADVYTKQGSMQIRQATDLFLYRDLRRVKRETSSGGSGTHRSSSGRSHGGGGGKF